MFICTRHTDMQLLRTFPTLGLLVVLDYLTELPPKFGLERVHFWRHQTTVSYSIAKTATALNNATNRQNQLIENTLLTKR